MRVRWVGITAALVLAVALGAAVGYRVGVERRPEPASFGAAPVPARSPSYPVIPVVVAPDNPASPLEPGLATKPARLGSKPFQVAVPAPKGWVRSDSNVSEWLWYPSWALGKDAYFVRVRLVGNDYQTIDSAMRTRLGRLDEATSVSDLQIESRDHDRFVANYVNDEHRRVAYEGFLSRTDNDMADVYIAVIGREVDRAGLADLFNRLMTETAPVD